MYDILHTNMSQIAPTGNTYEEDKAMWTSCVKPALEQGRRNIILIFKENDLAGFFQYYINETTFMMDEIQFKPEYQGSGIFAELYSYLVKIIPSETRYVYPIFREKPKEADLPYSNRLLLILVDPKGIEPSTSALRTQRSPNWATGPCHFDLISVPLFCQKVKRVMQILFASAGHIL